MTYISGFGSALPAKIVKNEDLTSTAGVDPIWTSQHLNIQERRVCDQETIVDLATSAAKQAISKAGNPSIDLIIVGTTTPHKQAPATACYIQEKLALLGVPAFDMNSVCASFIYAMVTANAIMANKEYRNILVIGADTLSKYTDWKDRNCVFFGDGAGAVVLSQGNGVLSYDWGSDGRGAEAWTIENHETWRMDGKWVYQLAVKYLEKSIRSTLDKSGLSASDISYVIPHQPGIKILQEVAGRLGIPFEKVHTVMDKYSNTSSASIPIALCDALDKKKIRKGDKILLAGVGAGWTYASMIMEWQCTDT